jgi:effector-binding domain-containing protein
MISEPKIENRSAQHYMGIRTQVPTSDLPVVIPQFIGEVAAWLGKQGAAPAGAPFIRYHVINMPGRLDIEIGFPVASALSGDNRVKAGVLPAGRYGTVLYTGNYDGLMEANRVLIEWAREKGIEWDTYPSDMGDGFGARFETYLTNPDEEPDLSKHQTIVAIRLADHQPH